MQQNNNQHIDDTFLNELGNKGGFDVPEGYFETLQKNILNKTINRGFVVPDNYFEALPSRIATKVATSEIKIIHYSFKQYVKWIAAASVILIAGIAFWLSQPTNQNNYISQMDRLSYVDIISYVELSDIQDPVLYETTYQADELTTLQAEKYLLENIPDEQLIMEEL